MPSCACKKKTRHHGAGTRRERRPHRTLGGAGCELAPDLLRDQAHQLQLFLFFNDTATTEIYTLSLHDALPIYADGCTAARRLGPRALREAREGAGPRRSEEHTSELQSRSELVCRHLLEKN